MKQVEKGLLMTPRPVNEFPVVEFTAITMAMFLSKVNPVGNNGITTQGTGVTQVDPATLAE